MKTNWGNSPHGRGGGGVVSQILMLIISHESRLQVADLWATSLCYLLSDSFMINIKLFVKHP